MAFDKEQRAALEILESIENGTTSAAGSFHLIEHADPTLIYFIFEWLKQSYAGHPAAREAFSGPLLLVPWGRIWNGFWVMLVTQLYLPCSWFRPFTRDRWPCVRSPVVRL